MIQKVKKIVKDLKVPATTEYEYVEYLNPKLLYYPVTTDRTPKGEILINEGDYVKVGQVIGVRDGGFFKQNIHSTVSGIYKGIEKKFYRSGKKVDCAVIENDYKEIYDDHITDLSIEEMFNLSKDEIIDAVEKNSVIGLGGGAFPTAVKLKIDKKIDTVILNGVECEPYLLSDYYAILKYAKEIIIGLQLTLKAYEATIGYIAVKGSNSELVQALEDALKELNYDNIVIKGVFDYYPQGYEKDVIKSTIGKKIAVTELPADYGIMVINTTTSKSIYDAVRYNLPILDREFLVTGDAINNPKRMLVKIGTLVPELVELCGGYKAEIEQRVLVFGGPMMGKAVAMDDVVVSKAVSTVMVLAKLNEKLQPCIRCATCVESCPSNLSPVQLSLAIAAKDKDALNKLKLNECILCGMCSYVCTSKIPLTDMMVKGKKLL